MHKKPLLFVSLCMHACTIMHSSCTVHLCTRLAKLAEIISQVGELSKATIQKCKSHTTSPLKVAI